MFTIIKNIIIITTPVISLFFYPVYFHLQNLKLSLYGLIFDQTGWLKHFDRVEGFDVWLTFDGVWWKSSLTKFCIKLFDRVAAFSVTMEDDQHCPER